MTERAIIFSGPMVRAILARRKTQTRRVVKQQPKVQMFPLLGRDGAPTGEWAIVDHPRVISRHLRCPYGQPGDRLWVRETWAHVQTWDDVGALGDDMPARSEWSDGLASYRADGHDTIADLRAHLRVVGGCTTVAVNGERWRPSIHMPRWASRITLQVTDVRVERLQDISEGDAIAEGVGHWAMESNAVLTQETMRDCFAKLWDSINAKRGYAWESNPWVWVIEFRVLAEAITCAAR